MEFIGVIRQIGELQNVESNHTGVSINCRDVLVETVEEYPRSAAFTLKGDNARNFALPIGAQVRVFFDLRAFPSRNNPGRFFNTANAWRIRPLLNI
ncbi:MAG: DUF3127 domain-containing protein [Bacteroidales bacterium]|nr:DUF3127 domain-containing protein [Bacteroidales bacterium]